MKLHKTKVTIIGGGIIALEHAKALKALSVQFDFVVRSEITRQRLLVHFPESTVQIGGLRADTRINDNVVVAVDVDNLFSMVKLLVDKRVSKILVEKPLSFRNDELLSLTGNKYSKVIIAFNRLCFPSLLTVKSMIEADGGIRTVRGEFTEAIWKIDENTFSESTLDNWILANSTHVISTVFNLVDTPLNFSVISAENTTEGLKKKSKYAFIGIGQKNELILLHADWGAPGSWCIEITTSNAKYFMKPMETLQIQKQGSFKLQEVSLDYLEPAGIKTGFYNQAKKWLQGNDEDLITVEKYLKHKKILEAFEKDSYYTSF